jgi:hypothetical protein
MNRRASDAPTSTTILHRARRNSLCDLRVAFRRIDPTVLRTADADVAAYVASRNVRLRVRAPRPAAVGEMRTSQPVFEISRFYARKERALSQVEHDK